MTCTRYGQVELSTLSLRPFCLARGTVGTYGLALHSVKTVGGLTTEIDGRFASFCCVRLVMSF